MVSVQLQEKGKQKRRFTKGKLMPCLQCAIHCHRILYLQYKKTWPTAVCFKSRICSPPKQVLQRAAAFCAKLRLLLGSHKCHQ